jgi:hypothetical protein
MMGFLAPDWLVVIATLAAICAFIAGRVRLAGMLAMPALMRFVAWPALVAVLQGIPPLLLVIAGVLALPVIIVRAGRRLLIIFVGAQAADHAIGRALGEGLISIFQRDPR